MGIISLDSWCADVWIRDHSRVIFVTQTQVYFQKHKVVTAQNWDTVKAVSNMDLIKFKWVRRLHAPTV
jgi:hypothetical protein